MEVIVRRQESSDNSVSLVPYGEVSGIFKEEFGLDWGRISINSGPRFLILELKKC